MIGPLIEMKGIEKVERIAVKKRAKVVTGGSRATPLIRGWGGSLDDDLAAKLKTESRRADGFFSDTVNEALRLGLASQCVAVQRPPFKLRGRHLGDLKPGLSLDNVAELIERVEDPIYR